jgi:hypothetical protein
MSRRSITRVTLRCAAAVGPLLLAACVQPSADHCANRGNDAACADWYPDGSTPYCWICTSKHNGCGAEPPSEPSCIPDAPSSSSGPGTSGSDASSTTTLVPGTSSESSSSTQADDSSSSSTGPAAVCGNDQIEGDETCDGTDVANLDCGDFQLGDGPLRCSDDCTAFDPSLCPVQVMCGDGDISGTEECDGDNLGKATCADIGTFIGGELSCNGSCGFDTTECEQCRQAGEPCESIDDCCGNLNCGLLGLTKECSIL